MRKISVAIFALSVSIAATETTEAQIVQVEPGYIRAPFVRVYRTPDGGRRVQAPFTDVYSPGHRNFNDPDARHFNQQQADPNRPPRAADQRAGTPPRVPSNSQDELRRRLAAASVQLDQDLAGMEGGSDWQEYLKLPADIYAGLQRNEPTPIELDLKPGYFENALARYDKVSQDQQYSMITELQSYQDAYQHLINYYESLTTNKLTPPPAAPEQTGNLEELPAPDERG
ncbi:MAG: hypothetical protein WBF93_02245 [Pirellulales bacterium]